MRTLFTPFSFCSSASHVPHTYTRDETLPNSAQTFPHAFSVFPTLFTFRYDKLRFGTILFELLILLIRAFCPWENLIEIERRTTFLERLSKYSNIFRLETFLKIFFSVDGKCLIFLLGKRKNDKNLD